MMFKGMCLFGGLFVMSMFMLCSTKDGFITKGYVVGDSFSDIKIHVHLDLTSTMFNYTDCNILNAQTGVLFSEALLFAIDQINHQDLFQGLSLGIRVLDTCDKPKYNFYYFIIEDTMLTVGPYSAELSEFGTQFLSIFKASTISFGASANKLIENVEEFPDFFTTVPSDTYAARVFAAIAKRYHWEYTDMLYSHNEDGSSLAVQVKQAFSDNQLCTHTYQINSDEPIETYREQIKELLEKPKVKIIFVFLSFKGCRDFFTAAGIFGKRLRTKTFVLSPRCGTMVRIEPSIQPYLDGMFTIQPTDPQPKEFQEYFKSLTPESNQRNNVYFNFYWQMTHNCSLDPSATNFCRNVSSENFNHYAPVRPLINALYTSLYSVKDAFESYCAESSDKKKCYKSNSKSVKKYLDKFIPNTKFEAFNRTFRYHNDRYVVDSFDIFRFQRSASSGTYRFEKIGFWNVTRGDDDSALQMNNNVKINDSRCSMPCSANEITQLFSPGGCCWSCKKCPAVISIIANGTCKQCRIGYKASTDQRRCDKLPIITMTADSALSVAVVTISCVCFIAICLVLVIYVQNYSSHIIKSSSRELALFSLAGLSMMLLASVSFTWYPTILVCYSQKLLIGISLTCCYAPLVLKTNRVYRIFASSSKFKLRRLMLVSMRSQFMIILAMVGVELLMGVFWILTDKPAIQYTYPDHMQFVLQRCQLSGTGGFLNLIFPMGLMIACTFWAFKTRNLPEIFSEIKSIGATMYITLFLVAVAFAAMFILQQTDILFIDIYVNCFTLQAIVVVNLVGQYAMKIKTLYLKRNAEELKENQSEVTTVVMSNRFTASPGTSPKGLANVRHMSLATTNITLSTTALGSPMASVKRFNYDIRS